MTPGEVAFIAGQVAVGQMGTPVGVGDLAAQVEQVFANLGEISEGPRRRLRGSGAVHHLHDQSRAYPRMDVGALHPVSQAAPAASIRPTRCCRSTAGEARIPARGRGDRPGAWLILNPAGGVVLGLCPGDPRVSSMPGDRLLNEWQSGRDTGSSEQSRTSPRMTSLATMLTTSGGTRHWKADSLLRKRCAPWPRGSRR